MSSRVNRTPGTRGKFPKRLIDSIKSQQPQQESSRAVVVLVVNGKPEVHHIDAAIAREAVERHYAERRVY